MPRCRAVRTTTIVGHGGTNLKDNREFPRLDVRLSKEFAEEYIIEATDQREICVIQGNPNEIGGRTYVGMWPR